MEQAKQAAQQKDTHALQAAAHSIKGSLLFLNPAAAMKSAVEVEYAAVKGNLDAACTALNNLDTQFAIVCQSLQSFLKQNPDPSIADD
jgi:phage-related minor tail protein